MRLKESLERGLEIIKNDKDIAPGTYKFYKAHLLHFYGFLEENHPDVKTIKKINIDVLEKYQKHQEKTCCGETINKRIISIKKLYQMLKIDFGFADELKKYNKSKVHFDMVELEDVHVIRKTVFSWDDSIGNNLLHKCFLIILSETGIRRSELMYLEKKDFDFKNCLITLNSHTKTKKVRTVYFTEESKTILKKMHDIQHDHKLFFHNIVKNEPANFKSLDWFIKRIKTELNIELLHPHMFRHFFVTTWLNNGGTLKEVQAVSGIETLAVLNIYWHLAKEKVRESYNQRFNAVLKY